MKTKHIKAAEKVLNSFLKAWLDNKPEEMKKYCQKTWLDAHVDAIVYLNNMIVSLPILTWEITLGDTAGEACIDLIAYIFNPQLNINNNYRFRLICETAPYKPSLDGDWGVNPISMKKI